MKQSGIEKKLTELKKLHGLTQKELAEKCNVGIRTIQGIESEWCTEKHPLKDHSLRYPYQPEKGSSIPNHASHKIHYE